MTGDGVTSCLYFGRVMHKRLRPFGHRFSYRTFSLFLDLDDLPGLDRNLRVFSHNKANLFSFYDKDHGPRDGSPLRPWIDARLAAEGIDLEGGAVRMLCFPRVFGYVFNPLTLWFCHHRDGRLKAVLYEVRNTFGEKHCYLLPVSETWQEDQPLLQACDKAFYVSPFIGMTSRYNFRIKLPDEHLSVLIRQAVPEGELLVATQTGRRSPLTSAQLLSTVLRYPLLTFKVIAAIHWQALRLWVKGAPFQKRAGKKAGPSEDDAPSVGRHHVAEAGE